MTPQEKIWRLESQVYSLRETVIELAHVIHILRKMDEKSEATTPREVE